MIITIGEEEILLLIDKFNITQLKIGNNYTPIYNPPIEQSRYTITQLIQKATLKGPKT